MLPATSVLDPSMICAVVVTYEPDDSSLECVRSVIARCAHTVIVDNCSKEPRRVALRQLQGEAVTLIENDSNTGVAAGFNTGIRAAAERNYRWFLLFDQDTRIFPSTLPELVLVHAQCAAALGARLAFLGCGYYSTLEDGTIIHGQDAPRSSQSWYVTDLVITSGTLISWRNFQDLGAFREDFFIDHVDHDYSLRAQRMGFAVTRTTFPLMVHRMGAQRVRRRWRALGAKKMLNYYSPLRRYYQVRNFHALARSYEDEFPASIAQLRDWLRRELSRSLRYETGLIRILIAVFLARRDSRRGVTGKYKGGFAL